MTPEAHMFSKRLATVLTRTAVLTAVAGALAACEVNLNTEGITARETRSFKVTGRATVAVETFDGAIEVRSWDRPEIEIEIERRAMDQALIDGIQVAAEQEGDRIALKVTGPERYERSGVVVGVHISPTARLRVLVPRSSTVEAVSGDGSIALEDLDGRVVARTSDGSVRALRVSGEIVARSGDGSIRMERVSGSLDLETEDGSIVLEAAAPSVLRARTGDGSIRIEVEPDSVMADDWLLQTGDGSVVLRLPRSFNAEIDAETGDGRVRSSHPSLDAKAADDDDRERRRRTLKAPMGTGGRTLRVRTGEGSIRIES